MDNRFKLTRRQYYLVLSFFAPAFLLSLIFALTGTYPFGENHILFADLAGQFLPFLVSFSRRLKEGSSLLWSWEGGGGFDYLVNSSYYLISPANILLFLIPEHLVHIAIIPITIIKFGFAGLFLAIYLERITGRAGFLLPVMASMYALCSFMVQNYWCIMWLDSFALLPLVMLGLHSFMRQGKFKLYVISLFLAVICNFYFGWYICVFVALSFFGECFSLELDKKTFFKKLAQIAGYSMIAIGLAAFVLLPAYLHISQTRGSEPDPGVLFIYGVPDLLMSLAPFRQSTYQFSNLPYAYCGLLTIPGVALFFASRNISRKEKTAFAIIAVFLLLSMMTAPLDFVWNMNRRPVGILYRYTFLFAFAAISAAYKAYSALEPLDKKKYCYIGAFIIPFMICLAIEPGSLYLAPCIVLFIIYLYFINQYGKDRKKGFAIIIALLVFTELTLNGITVIGEYKRAPFKDYVYSYDSVTALLERRETPVNGLDRTDIYGYILPETKFNGALMTGAGGMSFWSSMIDSNLPDFCEGLGIISIDRAMTEFRETSPVSAMFTNTGYLIVTIGELNVKELWSEAAQKDGLVLYKNNYHLPFGFMVNRELAAYKPVEKNVFASQNSLFALATGLDSELFTIIDSFDNVTDEFVTVSKLGDTLYSYELKMNGGAEVVLEHFAEKSGLYFGYCDMSPKSDEDTLYQLTDILVITDYFNFIRPNTDGYPALFAAGSLNEGDSLVFSLMPRLRASNVVFAAAFLNEDVLNNGYTLLANQPLEISVFNDTYIKGSVTAKEDGLLYTSLPAGNNPHWRAYVDGIETPVILIDNLMASVEIPKGTHTVEFKYFNTHFAVGSVISAVSLAVMVLLSVRKDRPPRKAR